MKGLEMNTNPVSPVLPHEIPAAIITYWLGKINACKLPDGDIWAVKTLGFLIETLEAINTPTECWNTVANHTLSGTNYDFCHFHYTNLLASLSPHTSAEVRERIIERFVQRGEIEAAIRSAHPRKLRAEEILLIADYHYEQKTTSESIWDSITTAAEALHPVSFDTIAHVDRAAAGLRVRVYK